MPWLLSQERYPLPPLPCPLSAAGLTPNVAGALAYLVGAITGILFLVIDPFKTDRFVRFHAFQSIFFNLAWIAILDPLDDPWADAGRCVAWVVFHYSTAHQPADFDRWILPVDLPYVYGLPGQDIPTTGIGALAANQAGIAPVTGQRL